MSKTVYPKYHLQLSRPYPSQFPRYSERRLARERQNPPKPFKSFAMMIAYIIRKSPRRKMTVPQIYEAFKVMVPDYFGDDGHGRNPSYGKGWMVKHLQI